MTACLHCVVPVQSKVPSTKALPFAGQVVHANSTMSLEREAALISEAALDSVKAPAGALDFDLQVQDMSKVIAPTPSTLCNLLPFTWATDSSELLSGYDPGLAAGLHPKQQTWY